MNIGNTRKRDVAALVLAALLPTASLLGGCGARTAPNAVGDAASRDQTRPDPVPVKDAAPPPDAGFDERVVVDAGDDIGPMIDAEPLTGARSLTAGESHTCVVVADDTARCWGDNTHGQLGDGSKTTRPTPVEVAGLAAIKEIVAGHSHTCAVLRDGTARCWGNNRHHQLGALAPYDPLTPSPVSGLTGVTDLAAGSSHTCALLRDGTVRCWGRNLFGALGDGSETDRSSPVAVAGLGGVVAIAAWGFRTCALLAGGTVSCWGYGSELRSNGVWWHSATPVAVPGLTGVAGLAVSYSESCARLGDGSVRCWGDTPAPPTTLVAGLAGVVGLSAGDRFNCARLASTTVSCWGSNVVGQLGDGTTSPYRAAPRVISGLSGVIDLGLGGQHACALLRDDTARCWGNNDHGQLGDGTTTNRPRPVSVIGLP